MCQRRSEELIYIERHLHENRTTLSVGRVTLETLCHDCCRLAKGGIVERDLWEVRRREQNLSSSGHRIHPSQIKGRIASHST